MKISKVKCMDYIVTYEFPPGIEQKYKTNIGSILKRRYEDKRLINRLGKGKLLIDHEHIRDEIIEKLEKNKAKIVDVQEFEEFPDSIKDFITKGKKSSDQTVENPIDSQKIKSLQETVELLKEGFSELYKFHEKVSVNPNQKTFDKEFIQLNIDIIDKAKEIVDNV